MNVDKTSDRTQKIIDKALSEIASLRAQVDDLKSQQSSDAVAVVGLGCRFPGGVRSPSDYWEFLLRGGDGVVPVPPDRWDADQLFHPTAGTRGKIITREAGFLEDIHSFDSGFFGISPKEAASVDPQHRLLLEVTWEAFENASIDPTSLENEPVGVYVGISNFEYGAKMLWPADRRQISQHAGIGGMLCAASGRLSYTFGFSGPSMSVDTACSSSLVSTHLACQAIRAGECDLALSAGVNLFFGPETHINFSQARMLSPDGRCKTFDARADGYGRGEGCGVVILKRLTKALEDGDEILATICGSAVNQDGPSGGITVPNGPAQERVIRRALRVANLAPDQIGYVEAHGTGTPLGDPIEIGALTRAFSGRTDKLRVGSVKANFGHLESSAGIAGLIKTILMVKNKRIPRQCLFDSPNPEIDWDAAGMIEIPRTTLDWPSQTPFGGVSSFSFCGTNAHVVVGSAPPVNPSRPHAIGVPGPILISAHTEEALSDLVHGVTQVFGRADRAERLKIKATLGVGRAHLRFRCGLIELGSDASESDSVSQASLGVPISSNPNQEITFLFTGQGSQYPGMGLEMFDRYSAFRESVQSLDSVVRENAGWSLIERLHESAKPDAQIFASTATLQPVLYAIQVSLLRFWASLGLAPTRVAGHSIGELAAAVGAGVLDPFEGMLIAIERGRLMSELCPEAGMLAVRDEQDEYEDWLKDFPGLELSAVNGPTELVFGGLRENLNHCMEALIARGVEARMLPVERAFHTSLMSPMVEPFTSFLKNIDFQKPRIPMALNVSGDWSSKSPISAEYWVDQITSPVNFHGCMSKLLEKTPGVFLELGPRPVLIRQGQELERKIGENKSVWIPSLLPKRSEAQTIDSAVALMFCADVTLDWGVLFSGCRAAQTSGLPNYPFLKEEYRLPSGLETAPREIMGHPLAGEEFTSSVLPANLRVFGQSLSLDRINWLAHHKVFGAPVLPAAALIEMMLFALKQCDLPPDIADFQILKALDIPEVGELHLQTIVRQKEDGQSDLEILSRRDSASWTLHAKACGLKTSPLIKGADAPSHSDIEDTVDVPAFYQKMRDVGIEHYDRFQGMQEMRINREFVSVKLAEATRESGQTDDSYLIHPAMLDTAVQSAAAVLQDYEGAFLPVAAGQISLADAKEIPDRVVVDLREVAEDVSQGLVVSVFVWARERLVVSLHDLVFARASSDKFFRSSDLSRLCYETVWTAQPPVREFLAGEELFHATASEGVKQLTDASELRELYAERICSLNDSARLYAKTALARIAEMESLTIDDLLVGQRPAMQMDSAKDLQFSRYLTMAKTIAGCEVGSAPHAHDRRGVNSSETPAPDSASYPESDLVERFGECLADLLTGKQDSLDLLFPSGDVAKGRDFYRDSEGAAKINTAVAQALVTMAGRAEQPDGLRILEVGGGTGATTESILKAASEHLAEYAFSDVSTLFTRQADQRFGSDPKFSSFLLDVSRESPQLAALKNHYDVVIAANVLHATPDIRETLANVRSVLAPGGILVLIEAQPGQDWLEMIFGNIPGWWDFSDFRRGRSTPLIDSEEWIEMLTTSGFDAATTVSEDEGQSAFAGQHVIFARKEQALNLSPDKDELAVFGFCEDARKQFEDMSGWSLPNECFVAWSDAPKVPAQASRQVLMLPDLTMDISDLGETFDLAPAFEITSQLFHFLQVLVREDHPIPKEVVLVTRNCFPTADTPSDSDSGNFLLQGVLALARTAGIENVGLTIRCIDLEHRVGEAYPPETQASFRHFIAADSKEEQGHLNRKGELFSRRLIRTTLPNESDDELSAASERSAYIIAGGLGGIGRCATDWLAKAQDASHIILLGRSTLDESSEAWIRSLNSKTSVVEYRQVDITDLGALRRCLRDQPKDKIAGIFQCTGVLKDQPLASADWSAFCEVIEPKLRGTLNLLALFGGESPVPFTTFGSIASIFSPKGQASHSAANGFLDGVAAAAQRLGHPFKHAQWGPWSEVGAAASGDVQQGLERIGVKPFDPSAGISMVSEIARRRPRSLALMDVDWQQFLSRWPSRSLLSEIQEAVISAKADVPGESAGKPLGSRPVDNELLQKLRSQSRRQAETAIMTVLAELIAPVLGFRREDEVDRDLGFFDLGLDSLTSVELRDAIEKRLSIKLDATALFKFSSVRALSVALYDSILGGDQSSQGPDTGSGSFGSSTADNTPRSEEAFDIAADSEITQMSEAELEQLFDRHLSDQ